MPDTTPASWQPDPFGRFAQRYWDGSSWTENVTDAAGAQRTDPPVGSTAPSYAVAAPSGSGLPVPALVLAGVGALLVLLSDFALDWFSSRGSGVTLSDLRELASESDEVPFLVDQYMTFGWLLGLAAVALVFAALWTPALRKPLLVASVVIAVWHGWAAYDTGSDRISPEFGAWLGSVGFVVCAVALVVPRPATSNAT